MSVKSMSIVNTIIDYLTLGFIIIFVFVVILELLVQIPPFDIYKTTLNQNIQEVGYAFLSIILALANFLLHPTQFNQNVNNLALVILKLITYLGGSLESFINAIFQFIGFLLSSIYSFSGLGKNIVDLSSCTQGDAASGVNFCKAIFDASNTNNFNLSANNLNNHLLASKYIIIDQYDLSTLTFSFGIYIDIVDVGQNITFSGIFQLSLVGNANVGPLGILVFVQGSMPYLTISAIKPAFSIIDFLLAPFKNESAKLGSWYQIFQQLEAV